MAALLITPEVRKRIREVRDYANANAIPQDELLAMIAGKLAPIGDDPKHVCMIPNGFRAVFSTEDQPPGLCRHLSVSVENPDRIPNVHAVNILMEEFGFTAKVGDGLTHVYQEVIDPRTKHRAINVIEIVDQDSLRRHARSEENYPPEGGYQTVEDEVNAWLEEHDFLEGVLSPG